MIFYRVSLTLLIVLISSSGCLSASADIEFLKSVQKKGTRFAYAKSVFSSEEPQSKKNTVLHSSRVYPDTPVCVVDGSYIYSEIDLNLSSFRLEIQHIYRSLQQRTGLLGSGWKLGYEMQLYPLDFDGVPAIAIERADGRTVIFQQGKSGFVSHFGNKLKLTQNDEGIYLLTELGGRRIFFDRMGRLAKIENKNVKPLEILYDLTTNRPTEIRSRSQVLIRFMYNANGDIEKVEDFTGRCYSYHYDEAKRLVQVIDPLQHHWQYQYDENGYLQAIIDRRGNLQTEITYTPTGQVKSYTRNGEKYRLQYLGETQTTLTDTQGHQWTYSYLPSGVITQTQDPFGNISSREYDSFLRLIQETDKRGTTTKYVYDDANRTRHIINPLGSVTTHICKDRELVIKEPPGKITTRRFNEKGDLIEETFGTSDDVMHRTRYIYDAAGNLIQHIDPRGNTIQFAYNTDGYLVQKRDVGGNVTHWRYNSLGKIVWEKDPTGRITETSYDLLGRVIEITRTGESAIE